MKLLKISLLSACMALFAFGSAWAGGKEKPLTKKQLDWFAQKEWLKGISAVPDPSLDKETFIRHYQKHPERWEAAFKFMRENNLTTCPLGKTVLSDDISVNVSEYTTREPGEEKLEAHRQYIDLQYVVVGKELQGVAKLNETKEVAPYDEKKDVGFYKTPVINYHVAAPDRFLIYFPGDAHIPNIQYGEKATVRKVVFKIKVN